MAGIKDFHDLRHAFESNFIMSEASLKDVKEMFGYSDISMTNRYTHLKNIKSLEIISKEHVDVIVTDMIMPKLNGLQLIQEIRKTNSEILIFGMSGYPEGHNTNLDEGEIEDLNIHFVKKPFRAAEVLIPVREKFDKNKK